MPLRSPVLLKNSIPAIFQESCRVERVDDSARDVGVRAISTVNQFYEDEGRFALLAGVSRRVYPKRFQLTEQSAPSDRPISRLFLRGAGFLQPHPNLVV